ncbi:MAG TPA: neprosin family prolyl endopeptidase [Thermoanaerobaculia bacterium]|nr:neprosin family prolyl endopeptidase [Thermoanaerobaculia bacterium]
MYNHLLLTIGRSFLHQLKGALFLERPIVRVTSGASWLPCLFLAFGIHLAQGAEAAEPAASINHEKAIVPFEIFYQDALNAREEDYLGRKEYLVKDSTAFREMKNHLLALYEGINIRISYWDDNHIVDCVPIDQQPGLKAPGMEHHVLQRTPPMLPTRTPRVKNRSAGNEVDQLSGEQVREAATEVREESSGSPKVCPEGFVPMRRLELEDIARYQSLSAFLAKDHRDPPDLRDPIHRYAFGYQFVKNIGGGADLNIWSPNEKPGELSLSQIGVGFDDGYRVWQTAEAGWMVDQRFYGTPKAVFFIYWTTSNYANGCYNLTCTAFMQIDRQLIPGHSFPLSSVLGGTQQTIGLEWYRDPKTGNWWLYVRNVNDRTATAIGYYPRELYRGGEMFKDSNFLEFGGEVVAAVGQLKTGEMGSGIPPGNGPNVTAYQDYVHMFQSKGSITNWLPVTLTPTTPDPSCYRIQFVNTNQPSFSYFYFGGKGCPITNHPG